MAALVREAVQRLIEAQQQPQEDYVIVRRADLTLLLSTWLEKKAEDS